MFRWFPFRLQLATASLGLQQAGSSATEKPSEGGPTEAPTTTGSSASSCTQSGSKRILTLPYRVIDDVSVLQTTCAQLLTNCKTIAVDIEALCTPNSEQKHLGQISLLQLCARGEQYVHIIDALKLGIPAVVQHVGPILLSDRINKPMFDCRRDVEALSIQLNLKPRRVSDLQLFHTAIQWKMRGGNRRSGLQYVLKSMLGVDRQDGDSAVTAAMTLGNRPVWDVRPLPEHFLEYAADDVRHLLLLAEAMSARYPEKVEAVERLTALYVDHYSIGKPVEKEADPAPHQVLTDWLERLFGPAGVCSFCGQKGHSEQECFKKQGGQMKCSYCGDSGHIATMCFRKSPQLLKCSHCGQMGHSANRCYARKPCAVCGGHHPTESCHKKPLTTDSINPTK
jgi:hypothetical protein